MKPEDFDLFATTVKQRSGLVLTRDKAYLLESRLTPVARKHGLDGLDGLANAIRRGAVVEALLKDITDAMTTNESSFFRDQKPFEQFRDYVLPMLIEKRAESKVIRIWSAACSSGQEAYSLAMILAEQKEKLKGWKIDLIGTDISIDMVERAMAGVYTQFEIQRGMPITLLVKYFKQSGDKWIISPEIKAMTNFREFNLLGDLTPLGRFDVVFCRNVLIYFDQKTKSDVLSAVAGLMPPDGLLFLGGAETVLGITTRFRLVDGQRALYHLSQEKEGVRPAFPRSAGVSSQ